MNVLRVLLVASRRHGRLYIVLALSGMLLWLKRRRHRRMQIVLLRRHRRLNLIRIMLLLLLHLTISQVNQDYNKDKKKTSFAEDLLAWATEFDCNVDHCRLEVWANVE